MAERGRKYPRFLAVASIARRTRCSSLLVIIPLPLPSPIPLLVCSLPATFYLRARTLSVFPASRPRRFVRSSSPSCRSFGRDRARSCDVGRDFCCALCRTYKRMRLFPGPAMRATLCLLRRMRRAGEQTRSRTRERFPESRSSPPIIRVRPSAPQWAIGIISRVAAFLHRRRIDPAVTIEIVDSTYGATFSLYNVERPYNRVLQNPARRRHSLSLRAGYSPSSWLHHGYTRRLSTLSVPDVSAIDTTTIPRRQPGRFFSVRPSAPARSRRGLPFPIPERAAVGEGYRAATRSEGAGNLTRGAVLFSNGT